MSEIRTETVPLVDGSALRLTVAEPIGSVRGGIVVLHEARGMTDEVRNMVRGLAAEGWLTVAPHLYHRDDADEIGEDDGDRIRDQVGRIDGGQVMADTDTAFGWLAEHEVTADRMGVLGFDTGATVALLVATERTMGAAVSVADEASVSAVADRLPSTADAMAGLTCPWLGLYGSDFLKPANAYLKADAAQKGVDGQSTFQQVTITLGDFTITADDATIENGQIRLGANARVVMP